MSSEFRAMAVCYQEARKSPMELRPREDPLSKKKRNRQQISIQPDWKIEKREVIGTKRALAYKAWKDARLGTFGPASEVRHIDPETVDLPTDKHR